MHTTLFFSSLLLAFLASGIILKLARANYPPPNIKNICFVFDALQLKRCIDYAVSLNAVAVLYPSVSLQEDPYLSLYAGSITHLFNDLYTDPLYNDEEHDITEELKFWFIYAQPRDREQYNDFVVYMLSIAPTKSIFICMEQGLSHFGINNIDYIRRTMGIGPRVIYHMNHERPWRSGGDVEKTASMGAIGGGGAAADPDLTVEVDAMGKATSTSSSSSSGAPKTSLNPSSPFLSSTQDLTFRSSDELVAAYNRHSLVLRNYYFSPLLRSSVYVPLWAPKHGYLIGNASSPIAPLVMKKASSRSIPCSFEGRTKYAWDVNVNRKEMTAYSIADTQSSHVLERNHLFDLAREKKVGNCSIIESNKPASVDVEVDYYEQYIHRLADTAFALCPSGNNPETFRHYEALELGAIPIVIRPQVKEQNYLEHDLWKDYPGPIFSFWDELEAFFETAEVTSSAEQIDALQEKVRNWYHQKHKRDARHRLREILQFAFRNG